MEFEYSLYEFDIDRNLLGLVWTKSYFFEIDW